MKKRSTSSKVTSSIVKLSIIGFLLIIGIVMTFCTIDFGLTTYHSTTSSIKLGLDLKGGIYAVYEMDEAESTDNLSSRMDGTRTRLQNMLYNRGYSEATVVREGQTRLRVEVPNVDSPNQIFDLIGKPASLEFVLDETNEIVITGKNILKAEAVYQNSQPVVSLSLDDQGTEAFSNATSNNVGKTMSIVQIVDGERTTISSPKIEVAITNGKAVIDGMQTIENAQNLADQITSGQFEVKLSLLESNTVSPTLGEKALFYGIISGAVGLFLVMVFMCIVYRGLGGIASFSLLIYTVLMLFFLAVLPWVQLTLPGIAGIILSIGMAVDANVIIYERIKDEYRNGKSILAASHAGFKKASKAIIDSNVTTIIAAIVLLIFGTGSIQGFAITLLVGIILSLFTSLLVTRKLVKYTIALCPDKPGFYNLKRGKGFENLTPDSSDEEAIEEDEIEPTETNETLTGGVPANETI